MEIILTVALTGYLLCDGRSTLEYFTSHLTGSYGKQGPGTRQGLEYREETLMVITQFHYASIRKLLNKSIGSSCSTYDLLLLCNVKRISVRIVIERKKTVICPIYIYI